VLLRGGGRAEELLLDEVCRQAVQGIERDLRDILGRARQRTLLNLLTADKTLPAGLHAIRWSQQHESNEWVGKEGNKSMQSYFGVALSELVGDIAQLAGGELDVLCG
jgi:hypothetical protein